MCALESGLSPHATREAARPAHRKTEEVVMHRSTRFVSVVVIASALGLAACGGSSATSSQPAGPESSAAPALTGTIAFRRYFTADESWAGLFTVGADGKVRQLTDPPPGVKDDRPSWSPDGRLIAFTRCPQTAPCRLFEMAADGSGLAPIAPPCPQGADEQTCSDDANPSFSPDSRWVLFTQSTGRVRADSSGEEWIEHSALAIMRTDGSRRRVLYRRAPFSGDLNTPALSPDGRQIVFEQVNSGFSKLAGTQAVFVMGIDGSKPHRLTPWAEDDGDQPAWSPDGRWLVFHSHVEDGSQGQYFLIHPNGRGRRQLTHFPDGTWIGRASFSPDGDSIAIAKGPENGIAAVYTMRLDGGEIQRVTHSTYWDSAAAWGPAS
jgi:TolB protein